MRLRRLKRAYKRRSEEGWTKERLMAYYALSEREYEKVMECLKGIRQGVRI
jgi:hypothetical protein